MPDLFTRGARNLASRTFYDPKRNPMPISHHLLLCFLIEMISLYVALTKENKLFPIHLSVVILHVCFSSPGISLPSSYF